MRVVLLAGGFGTRLAEETDFRPKPMVEVGGMPILWHIMKTYSHFGFNNFVVCLGYKGFMIKDYYYHYYMHLADMTVDLEANEVTFLSPRSEPWKVTLVDTGLSTMTGGRIKRIRRHVGDEPFMLTYGDGVGDVDISALLRFHKTHGRLATLTAVQPHGRFGTLELDPQATVTAFKEKPKGEQAWVNAGFFVLEAKVFDYIDGDATPFEREPLERLAVEGQLKAYKHSGFWRPMDTLRDRQQLERLWSERSAPWKVW